MKIKFYVPNTEATLRALTAYHIPDRDAKKCLGRTLRGSKCKRGSEDLWCQAVGWWFPADAIEIL